MGLLDSVLGGTPDRSGLSAATKALLLVLAAKAAKDYMAHRGQASQGAAPGADASQAPGAGGGGLGGLLGGLLGGGQGGGAPGGLGSILGGGAQGGGAAGGLGSILGGGGLGGLAGALGGAGVLGSLVDQFQKGGHGDAMRSWIGQGPNQSIAPDQLGQILGPGPLQELTARTGMPQQALLEQLARELPAAMDHVTPQGRLPTDEELSAPGGRA